MNYHQFHPFAFCPHCGGEGTVHFAGPFEKHPRCILCKKICYFNPRPVAVGLMTFRTSCLDWHDTTNYDINVVLARRDLKPGKGMLALPGGFVEPGEDSATGAAREIKEELGIDVTFPNAPFAVHYAAKPNTMLLFHRVQISKELAEAARPVTETQEVVLTTLKQAALMAACGEIAFQTHSRVLIESALK